MKKTFIPLGVLLGLCLLTAGCASDTNAMPSPSPSESASVSPTVMQSTEAPTTAANDISATGTDMNGGIASTEDARRVMEAAEDELEKLSEVTDAQVVIAGSMAAVALEFDTQYQAGLDDRMQTMVKERIDSVAKGVERVVVTDDGDLFDQLQTLGDRLDGAVSLTEIQNELNAIINRIDAVQA